MAQCGDKPKRIAFGVAPLGIISIGIVPMGVVSIGVVPMGVISLGVVGMGVLNAAVVGMGVVVAGVHAMGIWSLTPGNDHQHHTNGAPQQLLLACPSRQVALQKARELASRACTPWATAGCPARSIRHNTPHTTTDS
jgi:hypothetical protein